MLFTHKNPQKKYKNLYKMDSLPEKKENNNVRTLKLAKFVVTVN